jgi:hypothetical protein
MAAPLGARLFGFIGGSFHSDSSIVNHLVVSCIHRNSELTEKINGLTGMMLATVPGEIRNVPFVKPTRGTT